MANFIKRIIIRNILGIEHVDVLVGKKNVLKGENGEGKSSFLKAVAATLGGGDQAELIRNGETKGETVLILNSDARVEMTTTAKKTRRTIKPGEGEPVTAVQSWIKDRLNPTSFNPVSFLIADEAAQIEMVLENANLKLSKDTLAKAVGLSNQTLLDSVRLNVGGEVVDPLGAIDDLRDWHYRRRTDRNSQAKAKRATVSELQKGVPSEDVKLPDITALRAELESIKTAAQTERAAAQTKDGVGKANFESSCQAEEREYQARLEAEERRYAAQRDADIEEARLRFEAICATARNNCEILCKTARDNWAKLHTDAIERKQACFERQSAETAEAVSAIQAKYGNRFAELKAEIAKTEAQEQEQARLSERRAIIAKTKNEAENIEAESESLTETIKRLDSLKSKLVESLPIQGLEIKAGRLYYKGTLLSTLNEEQRTDVALQLAVVMAGELKVIFLDGFEHVSKKNQERILAWVDKTDCQFFFAETCNDLPLTLNDKPVTTTA